MWRQRLATCSSTFTPAQFFIAVFLFAIIGRRWVCCDWRIRWIAMFLSRRYRGQNTRAHSGRQSFRCLGQAADTEIEMELIVGVALNLFLCGCLALPPGAAQAFKETPWE